MKYAALLLAIPRIAAADPLDEPVAPAPLVIREATPGPTYYRLPDDTVQGLSRSALGAAIRGDRAAFTLDALGGVAIGFGRGAKTGIVIEGGYSYSRFHDHLAVLGAGPALRRIGPAWATDAGSASISLVPHAVVGSIDGSFGYGLRTSAIATFAFVGLEVAHQYLVVGDRRIQEVQIALTFPVGLGG